MEQPDRISNLHTNIINHILSFLSTFDAVRTRVFARKWELLWANAPYLDLNEELYPFPERPFDNFVDGVHGLYMSPNIQRYVLSFRSLDYGFRAVDWVDFAVKRNVEELSIDLRSSYPFEMPFCESIKVLGLRLRYGELAMPISGCFSSLETLSLSALYFTDDAIQDVVSHRCPRLRSLTLKDCSGLDNLNISCPVLEYLNIDNYYGLEQLKVSAENLRILAVKRSFSNKRTYLLAISAPLLAISAPSLQTFKWSDLIIVDCCIENFTSLKAASISFRSVDKKEPYLQNANKFLSHFSSAESLTVKIPFFWAVGKDMLEGMWPPPRNLKKLKLPVGHDAFFLRATSHLFKFCSNLEILHIVVVDEDDQDMLGVLSSDDSFFDKGECSDYWTEPLTHLLEVRIHGFRGKEHEMKFVKYLLKNAEILKTVIIKSADEALIDQDVKTKINEKLLELTLASPYLIIFFT